MISSCIQTKEMLAFYFNTNFLNDPSSISSPFLFPGLMQYMRTKPPCTNCEYENIYKLSSFHMKNLESKNNLRQKKIC